MYKSWCWHDRQITSIQGGWFIRKSFSQRLKAAFIPSSASACVCVFRPLPLLTHVYCGHSISQQPGPWGDGCCYLLLVQQSALTAPAHLKQQPERAENIFCLSTESFDHRGPLKVDIGAHILGFGPQSLHCCADLTMCTGLRMNSHIHGLKRMNPNDFGDFCFFLLRFNAIIFPFCLVL